jgi:uncharacterized caspase-like protein
MRFGIGLIFTACFIALSSAASAEKRVALVVGNSAYDNVAPLPNPVNDASAISTLFKTAGFETVFARSNLGNLEFKRALREFTLAARDADIAVVFFAGHGIEVKGINYLIPVDAKLATDFDAEDEAVSLNRVIEAMETARRLRLVILDACRDNPFNKTMQRTVSVRAVAGGLAKVEPGAMDTLIAYAAKAGSTADDGKGANSPFTTALLKHLTVPGRDIRIAFGHVRDEVLKNTGSKQEPFVYGSLGGASLSLVPSAPAAPAVAAPASDPNSIVRRDYELVAQVGTKEAWDSFIATYASGFYSDLARAQRNKLAAEEVRVAAAEQARNALEEKNRLALEGARAADLAKAEDRAKAAERARVAAEQAKKAEEAKVAEAERVRAAALAKAAEEARITAEKEKLAAERLAAEKAKKDAEEKAAAAKLEAEKTATEKPIGQVAALTPQADPKAQTAVTLSRSLQAELQRVGCYSGSPEDSWTSSARNSLDRFNKRTGMKFDIKAASLDALDAVKGKTGRICPLECGVKQVERDGTCVAKTCPRGQTMDDDGDCSKPKEKERAAKQESPPDQSRSASVDVSSGSRVVIPRKTDKEPADGTVRYGMTMLVDDGSCPKGMIKEITGGSNNHGVSRTRRCVKR